MTTRHYRASNIFAVEQWARSWIRTHRDEFSPETGEPATLNATAVVDALEWCTTWAENDPRDNGGDSFWRRQHGRSEWPDIREVYFTTRSERTS